MTIRNCLKTCLACLLTALFLVFNACNNASDNDSKDIDSSKTSKKFQLDSTKSTLFQVGDEMFSIPSPVQTAILIKESGSSYNPDMLNDPERAPSYSTKFQKALALGIYGADLGYVTMYDRNQDALAYMKSTKRIADDLGVTNAFSKSTFDRFQKNLGNKDSLLVLVSDAYLASDAYLKNNDRDDVGSLILAGGWVEGLYFATNVVQISSNNEVRVRIGEQKTSLENLIKILQKYANNEEFAEFTDDLIDLYYLFDNVSMVYTFREPSVDPEKKITVINSTSEIQLTDEDLKDIANKINDIRNQIVG